MTMRSIGPSGMFEEKPFLGLQRSINQLFRDFGRDWNIDWPQAVFARNGDQMLIPSIDLSEDDKNVIVSAEMPGMDAKNVQVSIKDDVLTIKGEKKFETEEKKKNYYRSECHYGTFERMIPLPVQVENEKIQAVYKNGVLNITLPKTPEAQKHARTVQVRAG